MISEKQHRMLEASIAQQGLPRERVKEWCQRRWPGFEHFPTMGQEEFQRLLVLLPHFAAKIQHENYLPNQPGHWYQKQDLSWVHYDGDNHPPGARVCVVARGFREHKRA